MLCAVALAFVFDGVCAQQASQTIMTAHGCPEAFPGELTHSTYHWCNKTTPLRRKCGADGILSHGLCEEEQLRVGQWNSAVAWLGPSAARHRCYTSNPSGASRGYRWG